MTTQVGLATIGGPKKALKLSVTGTDGQWNECVDAVNSLSLYKVMKGEKLTHYSGQYAAGGAVFRIYNTQTGTVRAVFFGNLITEEKVYPFTKPITVQENDILQVYVVAVPT